MPSLDSPIKMGSGGGSLGIQDNTRVVSNIKVEVDTDPLKEVILQGDEPNFDRDLKVLKTSQLVQQVLNLFVRFLVLVDHQAQVGFERSHSTSTTKIFPRFWFDSSLYQFHEWIEISLDSTTHATGALSMSNII